MFENAEHLEKFLSICEDSVFPHRDELLRGVKNGEYSLASYSESGVPSESLLETYTVKAQIAAKHGGQHAKQLVADTREFLEELKMVSPDKINFWHFSVDESSGYVLFEGETCRRILGCIFTVDKRKVSESDWERLWS